MTKDDIPFGLKLFFCLLRCSSLTYRCGYAALLAPGIRRKIESAIVMVFMEQYTLEIAIPHARIDGIDDFILSIARVKEGLPFDSIDNKPVKVLFLIAAPQSRQGDYIKLLAQIIFFAKDKNNFKQLVNAEAGDLERYIKEEK